MAAETPAEETALPDRAPAGSDDAALPTGVGADRRQHPRHPSSDLKTLAAKLASGADIRLIDLSRGGAQLETDRRFLPNSTISLRLVTTDGTFVVNGRVVRSRIVRLEKGGLGYNVAVAFNEALQTLMEEPAVHVPAAEPHETVLAFSTTLPPRRAETVDTPAVVATEDFTVEPASDVAPDEQAAFEATVENAPTMLTVTASVAHTGEELRDMFNGNDW